MDVRILIATCTGAARLSERYGRRLVLVRATIDPVGEIQRLREGAYCSLVLGLNGGVSFDAEPGWDDWERVSLVHGMMGGPEHDGIRLEGSELKVSVGGGATFSAFQLSLTSHLRDRRYDEALLHPRAIAFRRSHGLPVDVRPRYAGENSHRVYDLVAIDPWTEMPFLLANAAAALTTLSDQSAGPQPDTIR